MALRLTGPMENNTIGNATVRLTIPGNAVGSFDMAVQAAWAAAGRPWLGDAPFTASVCFYGAAADLPLDMLVEAVLVSLAGLAFADNSHVRLSGCRKLPVDAAGPRAVVELRRPR
jgi:hypothetical protein